MYKRQHDTADNAMGGRAATIGLARREPCATFWQWQRERGRLLSKRSPRLSQVKRSADAPPPPVIGLEPPCGDVVPSWAGGEPY